MDVSFPTKQIHIEASGYNIDDVRAIYTTFEKLVEEQGDIEIAGLDKPADKTADEFDQFKRDARAAFGVRVTVIRSDGSSTIGDNVDVIAIKPNGPLITKIYMSNVAPFHKIVGVNPTHSFELFLDFSVPPLLDPATPVSNATPNNSGFNISGDRPGWVAGAERAYTENIRKKFRYRNILHRPFMYDAGLMPFAIPLAFYACWLSSGFIEARLGYSTFLSSAAYAYVGLMAIWAYRVLFSYTKWAFPMLEIIDQPSASRKHRLFFWAIILAIGAAFFWNSLEPYLSVQAIQGVLDEPPAAQATK